MHLYSNPARTLLVQERLLDDVEMVWASHLIGKLDENGKVGERAQDVVARRGHDPSKPTIQVSQRRLLAGCFDLSLLEC